MKIEFRRDGSALVARITIHVPTHGDITYQAKFITADDHYAGFLVSAVQSQMGDDLYEIRQSAYEQGWRDAKAKKGPKQTWFSRFWL